MNDGGPAFPGWAVATEEVAPFEMREGRLQGTRAERQLPVEGMSLRDWFAGQVLPSVYEDLSEVNEETIWKVAYRIADGMLNERDKPK